MCVDPLAMASSTGDSVALRLTAVQFLLTFGSQKSVNVYAAPADRMGALTEILTTLSAPSGSPRALLTNPPAAGAAELCS